MAVKRRGGGERSEESRLNAGGIATGADAGVGRVTLAGISHRPPGPSCCRVGVLENSFQI